MELERERKYDLEERSLEFAIRVRDFVKITPKSISNNVYARQLIRSSSSIGANYIEANDSLGSKDKLMRIRICKKEAKETVYWLKLIEGPEIEQQKLLKEAGELLLILGAIYKKLGTPL